MRNYIAQLGHNKNEYISIFFLKHHNSHQTSSVDQKKLHFCARNRPSKEVEEVEDWGSALKNGMRNSEKRDFSVEGRRNPVI